MYVLREYQERCVNALWHFFASGKRGNPLVVVPTGGGKSVIIADFCRRALEEYPETRILLLTHVRELVEQDAEKLSALLGDATVGVYSAGLKRRELDRPITVAGVQSIAHRLDEIGRFDLVVIDEAHLVPKAGEGRYRAVLSALTERNEHLRVIGFSATPYRLGTGMLHRGDGRIFHHIAIEIGIPELIDAGYLSPVRSKLGKTQPDLGGVHKRAGEYVGKEMAAAMGEGLLIERALDEVDLYAKDRKSILFFCAGVDHAHTVTSALEARGIATECVTGKTKAADRDAAVERFRSGATRALVNVAVFTTGFDAPNVDCVVLMRATMSPGLYYQMIGRGLRISPLKTDCLVLDFGRNIETHGPLDDLNVGPERAKKMGEAEPSFRVCPRCCEVTLLALPECSACGYEFPVFDSDNDPHEATASDGALLKRDERPVLFDVSSVHVTRHTKAGKPDSLRVTYRCGLRSVSEWVCLEHAGFAARKARLWWRERAAGEVPTSVDEALARVEDIRRPTQIEVQKDGKFDRVVRVVWKEKAA